MRIIRRFYYRFYQFLFWSVTRSPVLSLFGVSAARIQAFRKPVMSPAARIADETGETMDGECTWFHAASVGELEMLIPLIEAFAKEASAKKNTTLGVSVFSESALPFLRRLPAGVVYAGLSPADQDWKKFFQKFRVKKVIVSKYEAWPGLWCACSELDLPILLINAQWRKSLAFARFALRVFGVPLPRFFFYATDPAQALALKTHFPNAQIRIASDPRWVRVARRAQSAADHPRVREWKEKTKHLPRPFVMIGSAWPEDLERLVPQFKDQAGTLWVVPHSLAPENISRMKQQLSALQNFVLVEEMGMLLELYSLADRIFVGGGFGKGIHSTLEAAAYPVPIACGPHRVDEFFETRELIEKGMLTVFQDDSEIHANIQRWLTSTRSAPADSGLKTKISEFSALVEESFKIR